MALRVLCSCLCLTWYGGHIQGSYHNETDITSPLSKQVVAQRTARSGPHRSSMFITINMLLCRDKTERPDQFIAICRAAAFRRFIRNFLQRHYTLNHWCLSLFYSGENIFERSWGEKLVELDCLWAFPKGKVGKRDLGLINVVSWWIDVVNRVCVCFPVWCTQPLVSDQHIQQPLLHWVIIKVTVKLVSRDIHQLQLIKLHHFKVETFKLI